MAQQERAARTRDMLIESAAELFDRKGFALASLSMISARAGVSNGALHFHFGSKTSLAEAVEKEAVYRLARITGRSGDQAPGGALQLLIDATHSLVQGLGRDAILRAGFDPRQSLGSQGAAGAARGLWRGWVAEVLDRADREGATARGVPTDTVAATVVAVTMGLGLPNGQGGQGGSSNAVTRFWGLLLPRLAADGALGDLVASGSTRAETH
ncbi:TetR family transcriptional regulator [Streptomyces sp. NPDC059131]